MRLWIDGQCFQTPSRLKGIGRYVRELVSSIAEGYDDIELMMSFNAAMGDAAVAARKAVSEWIEPRNIHVWHGDAEAGEAREGYSLARKLSEVAIAHHVNCLEPDIALSASPFEGFDDNAVPLLPGGFCAAPVASIFYDAIPLHFPERYLRNGEAETCYRRRLAAFEHFALNLCISAYSRDELLAHFPRSKAVNIAAGVSWSRSASIAVEALKQAVAADSRSAPGGREASRKRIADGLKLPTSQRPSVAQMLSLAEPLEDGTARLIVDATSTTIVDHATGIQRVVKHICRELARQTTAQSEKIISFCTDRSGWHDAGGCFSSHPKGKQEHKIRFRNGDTVLMLDSSWPFYRLHSDYLRAFRIRGIDVVSCLYDTVPLRTPAFSNPDARIIFSEWFRTALTWSNGFVCISRAVADELHAILDAISFPHCMRIGYWPLGADFVDGASRAGAPGTAPHNPRPIFLMVGTLEPRKGHRVALEAFEELWAAGVDAELVIVGKEGWDTEALAQRIRMHPEYGRRVFWHEKADDAALSALYERCDALLAASFAEGFGLPLVEAGHFGKPVIASDIPVFREVAVGAPSARFFETGSAKALTAAVKDFLRARTRKSAKASSAAWSSWRESAAQLEKVVLGGNWYKVYTPRQRKDYVPLDNLGRVRMDAPLKPEERTHALRHVEGPDPIDGGRALKITVAVTNLSSLVWSSQGAPDGSLSVSLSYHILDHQGIPLRMNNDRTFIPFVHIPGDTLYMAVAVPADWKERGASFVDIELVQEGVSWFGDPLRVAL